MSKSQLSVKSWGAFDWRGKNTELQLFAVGWARWILGIDAGWGDIPCRPRHKSVYIVIRPMLMI